MPNINDYLIWRGDIPIGKEFPFNEVDSMILARFSYLRFDTIKMEGKETIESISNKMEILKNEEFLYNGDKELITYLGRSTRFKDMVITDYVKNQDHKAEEQFGAITIHISEDELYVSFIGTDATIIGWKEDFNMAFMEHVPCQIAGRAYLENVAKKYPEKKIRIGGHSKGGNVAIYSAITVENTIQDRIIKVDNFDGPGFSKEIITKYQNSNILKKIETFIPQDSIIGRLLNHKEKITVVLSVEKGIYQHDIYSWQVLDREIIKEEKNTDNSENVNKTITNWLEITSNEQRKIFIDSLFEIIYSTEANTFGEITFSKSIPKMLQKYKTISPEERKSITNMLKVFAVSYFNVIKDSQINKFENIKELYKRKNNV